MPKTVGSRQGLQGDLVCFQDDYQAEVNLKKQTAAFFFFFFFSQQEKAMMAMVSVADNDILTPNVGGTLLATKRSTLTQVCTC